MFDCHERSVNDSFSCFFATHDDRTRTDDGRSVKDVTCVLTECGHYTQRLVVRTHESRLDNQAEWQRARGLYGIPI